MKCDANSAIIYCYLLAFSVRVYIHTYRLYSPYEECNNYYVDTAIHAGRQLLLCISLHHNQIIIILPCNKNCALFSFIASLYI